MSNQPPSPGGSMDVQYAPSVHSQSSTANWDGSMARYNPTGGTPASGSTTSLDPRYYTQILQPPTGSAVSSMSGSNPLLSSQPAQRPGTSGPPSSVSPPPQGQGSTPAPQGGPSRPVSATSTMNSDEARMAQLAAEQKRAEIYAERQEADRYARMHDLPTAQPTMTPPPVAAPAAGPATGDQQILWIATDRNPLQSPQLTHATRLYFRAGMPAGTIRDRIAPNSGGQSQIYSIPATPGQPHLIPAASWNGTVRELFTSCNVQSPAVLYLRVVGVAPAAAGHGTNVGGPAYPSPGGNPLYPNPGDKNNPASTMGRLRGFLKGSSSKNK